MASGSGTLIEGNRVGSDAEGAAGLAPDATGVRIGKGIGSDVRGQPRLRDSTGIEIGGDGSHVYGNHVGTDATRTAPVPNLFGVSVQGSGNQIGAVRAGWPTSSRGTPPAG